MLSGKGDEPYLMNMLRRLMYGRYGSDQLSLFLLDLSLPELDGFGVLRYLRSRPPLRNLQVLAIADDPSLGGRALELGADDVILRPIDPEQVRRQLG